MRYFEDFQPGQVFDLGSVALTEAEIVAFAERYDPQPFHLSAESAKDSPFGGVIASGMQTLAVFMRLFVDSVLNNAISLASPGFDEVRWRLPVRPGERLQGRSTVATCTPSRSRPEMGIVTFHHELVNDAGALVMSLSAPSSSAEDPPDSAGRNRPPWHGRRAAAFSRHRNGRCSG